MDILTLVNVLDRVLAFDNRFSQKHHILYVHLDKCIWKSHWSVILSSTSWFNRMNEKSARRSASEPGCVLKLRQHDHVSRDNWDDSGNPDVVQTTLKMGTPCALFLSSPLLPLPASSMFRDNDIRARKTVQILQGDIHDFGVYKAEMRALLSYKNFKGWDVAQR